MLNQNGKIMKDLITAITADFEYHEGEYNFSTTYLGKEMEIQGNITDGAFENLWVVLDNNYVTGSLASMIEFMLINLTESEFLNKESDLESEKRFDDKGNEI